MAHRSPRRDYHAKSQVKQARRRNSAVSAKLAPGKRPVSRRSIAARSEALPFSPPEDWHEPAEHASQATEYRFIHQTPGAGYRHAVSERDVRARLGELPQEFLRDLEVVQLSRMTRKKQSLPCYGMQWGPALYLYPIDESLVEYFLTPPAPSVVTETKMYGGRWNESPGQWTLTWTERTIKDFYLNNILIHELGHLLDERNSSYTDRERFAEWFAIEFGYRRTGGAEARRPRRKRRRRHAG